MCAENFSLLNVALVIIALLRTELVLIDFGEALCMKEDDEHNESVGTPYYVAPEIIDNHFEHPRTCRVLKTSVRLTPAPMFPLGT